MKPVLFLTMSNLDKIKYKDSVIELQELLILKGYNIQKDGIFGNETHFAVLDFQSKDPSLEMDGYVGNKTWLRLIGESFWAESDLEIEITDYFLENKEYFRDSHEKEAVWLHHTAGGGNAYYVIQSWENDKRRNGSELEVATAFVIARESNSRNKNFNCSEGEIFRAFPEKFWAHHLGIKHPNNAQLNAKSIGVELCSYGQLNLTKRGHFTTIYGNVIDSKDVYDHKKEFRGHRYWHKYSDQQLESLRILLLELKDKYNLRYQSSFDESFFEYDPSLLNVQKGIFTHVQVRKDKFDCFPQPELIEVLNSL